MGEEQVRLPVFLQLSVKSVTSSKLKVFKKCTAPSGKKAGVFLNPADQTGAGTP